MKSQTILALSVIWFFCYCSPLSSQHEKLTPLTLTLQTTAASTFGGTDGAINLTIQGGETPYTINWSNDATTEDLNGLHAGFYSVTITDAHGETASVSTRVLQPFRVTQITSGPYDDRDAFFSPDGQSLVFTSNRDGMDDIYVMNVDGANIRRVHDGQGYHSDWSRDGEFILFTSQRSGNDDIWQMDVASGDLLQLTDNAARDEDSCWGHDGTYILFDSNRNGAWNIWKKELTTDALTQLTHRTQGESCPACSPDGTRFAHCVNTGSGLDVYIQSLADGSSLALAKGGFNYVPEWAPNGQELALLSNRSGQFDLWLVLVDQSLWTPLTNDALGDGYPAWSPDGKKIVFDKGNMDNRDIYILELE